MRIAVSTPKPSALLAASTAIAVLAWAPTTAHAASARLQVALVPKRLGAPSSIVLAIDVQAPPGRVPVPLSGIAIRYPRGLGIALSGLGIETCNARALEAQGPTACPPDSVMGYGSGLGAIPFGPELIKEGAAVSVFRAPDQNGHLALLFDAQGITPVKANIVLSAVLLSARKPYGGAIRIAIPPIPSLPEGPDVSILQLRATIGPAAGMRYSEPSHGEPVTYRPKGILLPDRCPRRGFPFAASLTFADGSHASARTRVPCPAKTRTHRKGHERSRR